MPRETGKQRASGIPLDYFRQRNPLDRGKLLLAGGAAVVTVIWLVVGSLVGRPAEVWYSPGPLTAAHASFETDCLQCHVSFTPIVSDAALAVDKSAIDAKCQACHNVANKASSLGHHASQDPAMLACSSCHHEHRGSAASLVATANASCTSCHAQIAAHRAGESTLAPPVSEVGRFDAEHHPEFRSIKTDPRKFKFSIASHHQHLTDGFAADASGVPIMTVKQLSNPADKARYAAGRPDEQPVPKLACGSCHQANSPGTSTKPYADFSTAAHPAQASGAYMTPIAYDQQCRACHLLTVDAARSENHAFDVVPHHLQGEQLTAEVKRYWADRYLRENPEQLKRPLPLPSHPEEIENKNAGQWIDDKVTESLQHLATQCAKCHELDSDYKSAKSSGGDSLSQIKLSQLKDDLATRELTPQVQPTKIPQVWFEHAKFDHAAHRTVDCNKCHVGADPAVALPSKVKISAPMIPGRSTCVECHSPLQESTELPHGGARTDCVECHRFHNRDTTATLAPSP